MEICKRSLTVSMVAGIVIGGAWNHQRRVARQNQQRLERRDEFSQAFGFYPADLLINTSLDVLEAVQQILYRECDDVDSAEFQRLAELAMLFTPLSSTMIHQLFIRPAKEQQIRLVNGRIAMDILDSVLKKRSEEAGTESAEVRQLAHLQMADTRP